MTQDDYDQYAPVYFRSDYSQYSDEQIKELAPDGGWRPSIHMPRWASRITLEITGVRVERLQDIDAFSAAREGIKNTMGNPIIEFKSLWDSTNAKRGYGWENNPWVWVVGFKRVES